MFHYGLTERLEAAGSSVKSLLVHPGVVRSDIWAEHSGILGNFVGNSIGTPVEEGAVPLLHCMCNSDVQSGQFWGPTGPLGASGPLGLVKPEPWCTDDEAKQMLWKESCCAIGSNFACGLEMDAGIRCPDEHIPEH